MKSEGDDQKKTLARFCHLAGVDWSNKARKGVGRKENVQSQKRNESERIGTRMARMYMAHTPTHLAIPSRVPRLGMCNKSPIHPSHADIISHIPPSASLGEVARALGVSSRTVARWVETGQLSSLKIGKSVRVPRLAVAEFLASRAK